jgi:TPR repeat protein
MKIDEKLVTLHNKATDNDISILHSNTCSCFFCRQTYSARKVNDWITDNNGVTAICPECGMDAVIGDEGGEPLDKVTLKALNLAYYGEDFMENHPDAALKYINRYKQGKITHKKTNEALYIQYLALLARSGNSDAALSLGTLYEFGDEFTTPDPKEAFSYYASQLLHGEATALDRIGLLLESGKLGKVDEKGAYESFAKSMALGSLDSLVHFADCYSKGINVVRDDDFAFQILSDVFPEIYQRFVTTTGKDINIFPQLCYRLGIDYEYGRGIILDEGNALRFFLFAEFGYNLIKSSGLLKGELVEEFNDTEAHIQELAIKMKLHKDDPVFDNDTFSYSLLEDESGVLPFFIKSDISPVNYDKNASTFDFDINYAMPPLIIDVGNLFCGFVPGTIRWSFIDVSDVKFGRGSSFNTISGNADDGYSFVSGFADQAETVCRIILLRNGPKKKSKPDFGGSKKGQKA